MKRLAITSVLMAALALTAATAQDIDPETQKILDSYSRMNANVPPEVLGLMPAGLKVTLTNWMVEQTTGMMLSLSMDSVMGDAKFESKEPYSMALRIMMNAFNMGSDLGRMSADSGLKELRQEGKDGWIKLHPDVDSKELKVTTERIAVPKGFLLVQKIYRPAHDEGEGPVPESTSYAGYLYVEIEGGLLKAEVDRMPVRGPIEKWLRHVAAAALKLRLTDYFKK